MLAAVAKSAQLPFSPWLFSAMAGPTPASALLHSATMVAAGAYLLARLQPSLDHVAWFAPTTITFGLLTALAGGVVAAVQPHAKKLLAASTSAHYGLMFVAVGAGYPTVAIAHLVAHGALKALLFMSAGAAIDASDGEELATMRVGRLLPVVAGLTAVGALALAGVPPLGAAWTKEQIVAAAADTAPWLGALTVLAGALSAFYAARFQLLAYGRPAGTVPGPVGRRSSVTVTSASTVTAALIVLAAVSLALGVWWLPWGQQRLVATIGGALPAGSLGESVVALAAIGAAIAAAVALDHRGRLESPIGAGVGAALAEWFGLAGRPDASSSTPSSRWHRRPPGSTTVWSTEGSGPPPPPRRHWPAGSPPLTTGSSTPESGGPPDSPAERRGGPTEPPRSPSTGQWRGSPRSSGRRVEPVDDCSPAEPTSTTPPSPSGSWP